MSRVLPIAFVASLILSGAQIVSAQEYVEYVIQLEMRTDTETTSGKAEPVKDSDVRTLELLTRLNRRFQVRADFGKEALSAKGTLSKSEKGEFVVEIEYTHSLKIGESVLGPSGTLIQGESKTSGNSTLSVVPGTPVTLGGGSTS